MRHTIIVIRNFILELHGWWLIEIYNYERLMYLSCRREGRKIHQSILELERLDQLITMKDSCILLIEGRSR